MRPVWAGLLAATTLFLTVWLGVEAAGATVYNWGFVKNGIIDQTEPTPMAIPGRVVTLAASNQSDFVLTAEGNVWAWGFNGMGDLGNDETKSTATPIETLLPAGFAVTVGEARASGMAISAEGEAYVWGENHQGDLCTAGDGRIVTPRHPEQLKTKVVAVQGGETHTAWLTAEGSVLACGDNEDGALGVGSGVRESAKPLAVKLPVGERVVELSEGEHQALARTESGVVYGWGGNSHGQACTGSKETKVFLPERVPLPEPAKHISAGGDLPTDGASLITLADGEVEGCGFNRFGTAAPAVAANSVREPTLTGLTGVQEAVTGGMTSYALLENGKLYSWGSTEDGDIGNGTEGEGGIRTPVLVQENIASVSATARTVLTLSR